MPKPYVPTGRPAGRPSKPLVEKLGIKDVVARLKDTTSDRRFMPFSAYCPDCFPDGFPEGVRTMGCVHGTWVKRL